MPCAVSVLRSLPLRKWRSFIKFNCVGGEIKDEKELRRTQY